MGRPPSIDSLATVVSLAKIGDPTILRGPASARSLVYINSLHRKNTWSSLCILPPGGGSPVHIGNQETEITHVASLA